MRRVVRAFLRTLAFLAILTALALAGANTATGLRLIAAITNGATGGTLRISGLDGRFPDALRIEHLELRDSMGAWLTLADMRLDWSPARLIRGSLAIQRLTAREIRVARRPRPDTADGGGASLPFRIEADSIAIDRLVLAAPVAGIEAVLTVSGDGQMTSLSDGHARLALTAADGGSYRAALAIGAETVQLDLAVTEPANGLLAHAAGLPDIGGVAVTITAGGPWAALTVTSKADAGPLHASVNGRADLMHGTTDLTVDVASPAMSPLSGVTWDAMDAHLRVIGPLGAPTVSGGLHVTRLTAGDAATAAVNVDLTGDMGQLAMAADVTGMRIPGIQPELMGAAPMKVNLAARLDAPGTPFRVTVSHPLVEASCDCALGPMGGQVVIALPDLAPFAPLTGGPLAGALNTDITFDQTAGTTRVTAASRLRLTEGPAPLPALLGQETSISVKLAARDRDVTVSDVHIDGLYAAIGANGHFAPDSVDLAWNASATDLSRISANLTGAIQLKGHILGQPDNLTVTADLTGGVAVPGVQPGALNVHVAAQGLPAAPAGSITGGGDLLGSPLDLAVTAERRDGDIRISVARADWKSAHAEGGLTLIGPAFRPEGQILLSMARFDDLAPILGRALTGSLTAKLNGTPDRVGFDLDADKVGLPGVLAVSRLRIGATMDDPAGRRTLDASATAEDVDAGSLSGAALALRARGATDELGLRLTATVPNAGGAALRLGVEGTANVSARALAVSAINAGWNGATVRLLGPARIGFESGAVIDRLRLGLDRSVLEVSGRVSPMLDVTASLRDLAADVAALVFPGANLDGVISAEAKLTGQPDRPAGTIRINANGLRAKNPAFGGIPAMNLTAVAALSGDRVRVDAKANAGQSHLTITGQVPEAIAGALDLRAKGLLDAGALAPLAAAKGRRIGGSLAMDAAIGGTFKAPVFSGSANLTGGVFRDETLGARIEAITAHMELSGGTMRLAKASGTMGQGTLTATGTLGVLAPSIPIDLAVTARKAQVLGSDAMSVMIDSDLTLRGAIAGPMKLAGALTVLRADLRVPENTPAGVVTIPIDDPDRPPAPPPAPPPDIALDVALSAPDKVFVRGRGIDAELGGAIQLHGSLARPAASGGLALRHGSVSLSGQTLTFSQGKIGFDGARLTNPALDFAATSASSKVTATLKVDGTVKAPKFSLTSSPELPQDEILAQLLFKQSAASLSPLEIGQIAATLVSLSGVAPNVVNPLDRLRRGLSLDRLSVTTDTRGSPTLEAGRYIAPGIFIAAKPSVTGGGSQATVQIDLTRTLKLEATATAGGSDDSTGASSGANNSSVGLRYQIEY